MLQPNSQAEGRGWEMGSLLGWPHAKVLLYSIKAFPSQTPLLLLPSLSPQCGTAATRCPLRTAARRSLFAAHACSPHSCTPVGLEPRATLPLQRGNPRLARPAVRFSSVSYRVVLSLTLQQGAQPGESRAHLFAVTRLHQSLVKQWAAGARFAIF